MRGLGHTLHAPPCPRHRPRQTLVRHMDVLGPWVPKLSQLALLCSPRPWAVLGEPKDKGFVLGTHIDQVGLLTWDGPSDQEGAVQEEPPERPKKLAKVDTDADAAPGPLPEAWVFYDTTLRGKEPALGLTMKFLEVDTPWVHTPQLAMDPLDFAVRVWGQVGTQPWAGLWPQTLAHLRALQRLPCLFTGVLWALVALAEAKAMAMAGPGDGAAPGSCATSLVWTPDLLGALVGLASKHMHSGNVHVATAGLALFTVLHTGFPPAWGVHALCLARDIGVAASLVEWTFRVVVAPGFGKPNPGAVPALGLVMVLQQAVGVLVELPGPVAGVSKNTLFLFSETPLAHIAACPDTLLSWALALLQVVAVDEGGCHRPPMALETVLAIVRSIPNTAAPWIAAVLRGAAGRHAFHVQPPPVVVVTAAVAALCLLCKPGTVWWDALKPVVPCVQSGTHWAWRTLDTLVHALDPKPTPQRWVAETKRVAHARRTHALLQRAAGPPLAWHTNPGVFYKSLFHADADNPKAETFLNVTCLMHPRVPVDTAEGFGPTWAIVSSVLALERFSSGTPDVCFKDADRHFGGLLQEASALFAGLAKLSTSDPCKHGTLTRVCRVVLCSVSLLVQAHLKTHPKDVVADPAQSCDLQAGRVLGQGFLEALVAWCRVVIGLGVTHTEARSLDHSDYALAAGTAVRCLGHLMAAFPEVVEPFVTKVLPVIVLGSLAVDWFTPLCKPERTAPSTFYCRTGTTAGWITATWAFQTCPRPHHGRCTVCCGVPGGTPQDVPWVVPPCGHPQHKVCAMMVAPKAGLRGCTTCGQSIVGTVIATKGFGEVLAALEAQAAHLGFAT